MEKEILDQILEVYETELKNNDFDAIYKDLKVKHSSILGSILPNTFTKIITEAGIDPAEYVSKVYAGMYANLGYIYCIDLNRDKINFIESDAFAYSKINALMLPKKCKLDYQALNCNSIKEIYYPGTFDELIDIIWSNLYDYTSDTEFHCDTGVIKKSDYFDNSYIVVAKSSMDSVIYGGSKDYYYGMEDDISEDDGDIWGEMFFDIGERFIAPHTWHNKKDAQIEAKGLQKVADKLGGTPYTMIVEKLADYFAE